MYQKLPKEGEFLLHLIPQQIQLSFQRLRQAAGLSLLKGFVDAASVSSIGMSYFEKIVLGARTFSQLVN
ncbi:MAG: hypothetical protein CVU42_15890 [Chloroflexi bacterium HGW-Chloroflexi-4]|nr:MAG: hypothetical protein CVU42_15890 [Chloroflexi bacterium HGW-Chloroflexi-4]